MKTPPDAALKDQGCPLLASRKDSSTLVLGTGAGCQGHMDY